MLATRTNATRTNGIRRSQAGMTMLEVLITLVILAFGLLGLAGLHMKIQTLDMEAYQRAQAILLLHDMVERIQANSANVAAYIPAVGATPPYYGTDYTPPSDCTTSAAVSDICDWSNALQGAAETASAGKLGAMIGARGCIEQISAPNPAPGICLPGRYRVTVAWQALFPTTAPVLACASGKYGSPTNDALRRAISNDIVIGLPSCV